MATFKRILFPVEFTPQCQIAARHVATYARHFAAEVILLHVEVLPLEPYAWEPQTEWLTQRLDQFLVDEFAGVKVRSPGLQGRSYKRDRPLRHQRKADLIMMPTHGRGPFRRFVLGSVTAKVLHAMLRARFGRLRIWMRTALRCRQACPRFFAPWTWMTRGSILSVMLEFRSRNGCQTYRSARCPSGRDSTRSLSGSRVSGGPHGSGPRAPCRNATPSRLGSCCLCRRRKRSAICEQCGSIA